MAVKRPNPVRDYIAAHGENSITEFLSAFRAAEHGTVRPADAAPRSDKRNYAQNLSHALAVMVANLLRDRMPSVLPKPDGSGSESRARTGKGVKKLDVNYSTPELGLGLGVSIKTLNYRDPASARYTKNPTRIDNELRAEAMDYHERQPFAVLAFLLFLPADSCNDGVREKKKTSRSSFAQVVTVLRHRAGRTGPRDESQLFERGFIGLYETGRKPSVSFFDVKSKPPQFGRPKGKLLLSLDEVLRVVVARHDDRNSVKQAWDTHDAEDLAGLSLEELAETERLAATEEDEEDDSV